MRKKLPLSTLLSNVIKPSCCSPRLRRCKGHETIRVAEVARGYSLGYRAATKGVLESRAADGRHRPRHETYFPLTKAGSGGMSRDEASDLKRRIEKLQEAVARLQTENESLHVSDERYRALFEALPVSLQVVGRDGLILEVNPFHVAHMGNGRTTLTDYQGQNITTRRSVTAAGLTQEYRNVLRGVPFERSEVLYPALSGGGEGYFNVRGVPLQKGGEIVGAIYILEDVSVLKRAKTSWFARMTGSRRRWKRSGSFIRT